MVHEPHGLVAAPTLVGLQHVPSLGGNLVVPSQESEVKVGGRFGRLQLFSLQEACLTTRANCWIDQSLMIQSLNLLELYVLPSSPTTVCKSKSNLVYCTREVPTIIQVGVLGLTCDKHKKVWCCCTHGKEHSFNGKWSWVHWFIARQLHNLFPQEDDRPFTANHHHIITLKKRQSLSSTGDEAIDKHEQRSFALKCFHVVRISGPHETMCQQFLVRAHSQHSSAANLSTATRRVLRFGLLERMCFLRMNGIDKMNIDRCNRY